MVRHALVLMLFLTLIGCGGGDSAPANESSGSGDAPAPADATPPADAAPPAATASSGASLADDPCQALDAAEVAAALGGDASAVNETDEDLYNSDRNKSCQWTLASAEVETTVTLWIGLPAENAQPGAWARTIDGYIQNGEKLRTTTLNHEAASLGGTGPGALSEVHGGKFVKTRIYSWTQDDLLMRLTISNTPVDEMVDLPDPADGVMEQLVTAIVS